MKLSIEAKLALLLLALMLGAAALGIALFKMLGDGALAWLIAASLGVWPVLWLAHYLVRPLQRLLRALSSAVANYHDGDFSMSLVVDRDDELGVLVTAHNELGNALRKQREHLVQRELLLDTVMQNSPVATVLVDSHQRVVYANLAARHLLNEGRSFLGQDFAAIMQQCPDALRTALSSANDSQFSVDIQGFEEIFHLSQRPFALQGRRHRLYLLKCLTREHSRQEVAVWKKLIRVLSHELNNSLAPIASLAHTGAVLTQRGDTAALATVFATIGERAEHLHQFLSGYATLAKLPAPCPEHINWQELLDKLQSQQAFRMAGWLPAEPGWFDRGQLEQALINLLKNAHEAGGPADAIELEVKHSGAAQRIEVRDRGAGMSEQVLAQALLPFYSTKRTGTGLGLALAREIAEAHGGNIRLANREGGGLCVALMLPLVNSTKPQ